MEHPLLSLLDPPPTGFVYRSKLATRDVRRSVFALYAATVEEAEAALEPWRGKISGLLVTPGASLELALRPSGLYHLTTDLRAQVQLSHWVPMLLTVMEAETGQAERSRALVLEAARLANERSQATAEFANFRASLLAENHERRRIEQALRASEVRFRTIYNSVSDAIFIHQAQTGKILEVNRRACELFGFTEEEFRKLSVADLSAPGTEYTQTRALELIRGASPQPQIFTWQARHKSGRLFWVEINMRTAFILGEESVLVTVRDVTDRKEAEESKLRLESQLLQTQKLESLGVLAGGIAHDFNNLLLVILGNVDLAGAEMPPSSPGRAYLAEVDHAARRAADLCRQMLDYAGKGRFVAQPIQLNDLILDMDHLLKVSISKKTELNYQLSKSMPVIHADATQIRQVMMNLVINASEALGDHGGTVTLSTGIHVYTHADLANTILGSGLPEGPYAYLEVADTGCGMTPETQAKVFDPFFSTKFTGRGLGLATVYGIVRSHQGAIRLESAPGRGTTFRVLFPALQQAAPAPEQQELPVANSSWRGVGTILVVEDEAAVRTFARAVLERNGFSILAAEDGRQAVDLFKAYQARAGVSNQERIACVLLDLTMPHMGGEETFRALRALQKDLRIIVTSGYSEQDVVPRFAREERTGFLLKPYRPAALRAAVKTMLDTP